ncbi:LysR family transcriptional regulator [Rhodococcus hoagii]|nr:LysR family transcriptional regulator [Prescottella equi]
MDSRQLRYFLAVVDNGSVTKAAEVLYVAQPALSQSLRALEAELGAALFHRVPRGMELTGAGAALVGPARQVVQSSRRVDETVRRLVSLERGWLDVACPSDLAVDPSASLIAEFRARHPGVRINLVDPGPNADSTTVLRSARCEVAIDYLPVDDAKLATHLLGRRRLVLALPENYETTPARPSRSSRSPTCRWWRAVAGRWFARSSKESAASTVSPLVSWSRSSTNTTCTFWSSRGPARLSSPSRRRVSLNVVASGSCERHPSWDVSSGWCSAPAPFPRPRSPSSRSSPRPVMFSISDGRQAARAHRVTGGICRGIPETDPSWWKLIFDSGSSIVDGKTYAPEGDRTHE